MLPTSHSFSSNISQSDDSINVSARGRGMDFKVDFQHNITVPGLHPLYPNVHCTSNFDICQFTTGEGEINAASSVAF